MGGHRIAAGVREVTPRTSARRRRERVGPSSWRHRVNVSNASSGSFGSLPKLAIGGYNLAVVPSSSAMQDPISLTAQAHRGGVQVVLHLLNPGHQYIRPPAMEPAAARFSAERLRGAANGQAPAGDVPESDVYLLARTVEEDDGPDWVEVDLIDRCGEPVGPLHRGGMLPDDARAAADALEAAAAEIR